MTIEIVGGRRRPTSRHAAPVAPNSFGGRRIRARAIEIAAKGRPAGRPPAWTRPQASIADYLTDVLAGGWAYGTAGGETRKALRSTHALLTRTGPPRLARVASEEGGRRGVGGVGFALWRCAVVASGSVSVVSVRGLRAGDQSVVYVGRRCAGWEASALGNPFRSGPGEAAGVASARFRVWLRGVVAAGVAGSAQSVRRSDRQRQRRGRSCCGWRAGCGRAGGTCHAFVVREAVVFLASRG